MSGCDPARRIAHERLIERLRNAPGGDPEAFVNLAWSALATSGVSWIGFYRVSDDGQSMVLEQCRDRPACSPIGMHGVCGQAIRQGRTRVIADVADLGAEYVACDPRDRSEIVIPIRALSPSGTRVDRVLAPPCRPLRSRYTSRSLTLELDRCLAVATFSEPEPDPDTRRPIAGVPSTLAASVSRSLRRPSEPLSRTFRRSAAW